MPKRIYNGSHAAVEVPLPDGEVVCGKRGEAVEVDDETAMSLDESGNWTASSTSTTTPAAGGKE